MLFLLFVWVYILYSVKEQQVKIPKRNIRSDISSDRKFLKFVFEAKLLTIDIGETGSLTQAREIPW